MSGKSLFFEKSPPPITFPALAVATLFLRGKNKINYKLLWYGYKLKNEFIVGYGLDYNEKHRQLEDIYKLSEI